MIVFAYRITYSHMRKLIPILCFFLLSVEPVYAEISIAIGERKVEVKGLSCMIDIPVYVEDGTAMVPAQLLAIESGLELKKDLGRWKFFDNLGNPVVTFFDGFKRIEYKDTEKFLTRPATYNSGYLWVPAKDCAELLGLELTFDKETKKIIIQKPEVHASWVDRLTETVGTKNLVLSCLGIAIFFILMFFVLTPIRRGWRSFK